MAPPFSINDYTIEPQAVDWAALLADWSWLLPNECTIWLVNRFAEMVLVFADGSVHYFDVGAGTLTRIAQSRDEFREKIDEGNNANDWLMIALVDELVAHGMVLAPGQCYGYKFPPVLEGTYSLENCAPIAIDDYLGGYASIHRQLREIPDGTKVMLKVVNAPPWESSHD